MRRIALAVALTVSLAACGGASNGSGSQAADRAQLKPGAPAATGAAHAASLGRQQVRTSAMTVRVTDVAKAARDVVRTAEDAGGFLESERTAIDSTTMTVRVPPEEFTKTSDAFAALGTVTDRTVSTEDVTNDVADVQGRLKAARASTERVRGLLARASTISEITTLESELNEREAALESLETRQRALAGRTSFAAMTVTLTRPVLAARAKASDQGFGGGLRAGWSVFTTSAVVLLVILGALLPFAGAVAAVVVPLYYLRRRRVSARA